MAGIALVADDHPLCREAAKLALVAAGFDPDVHEAATLAEAVAVSTAMDLVILDLGLPDSKGIASLIDVKRAQPRAAILVVSGSEAADVEARVAASGAAGFVSKAAPFTDIVAAIQVIQGGERAFNSTVLAIAADAAREPERRLKSLTAAESRVLRAMAGGGLNKQIAHDLGLSEITVKQHVKAILRKLDVINRTQAVLKLHAAGN
jgi:DNA-binding NarL/FixJ family response regulator